MSKPPNTQVSMFQDEIDLKLASRNQSRIDLAHTKIAAPIGDLSPRCKSQCSGQCSGPFLWKLGVIRFGHYGQIPESNDRADIRPY
jgi:hypothetical protein